MSDIENGEISEEELEEILRKHKEWLVTDGESGEYADLREANLSERSLSRANLRKANLICANLSNADLSGADLSGADLSGADLSRANLSGANLSEAGFNLSNLIKADLSEANLSRANMSEANLFEANLNNATMINADLTNSFLTRSNLTAAYLSHANISQASLRQANLNSAIMNGVKGMDTAKLHNANFKDARGLLGTEFAQADITGCTLPEEIGEFTIFKTIEETSKNARAIFISMLTACIYSWLAIATAPDAGLISNTASIKLPIINTEISVFGFFMVAPLLLLSVFIYFHLYLQRLWEGLRHMPAILPDGKRLDQRAYPWLLNGMVRRHFEKLKKGRTLAAYVEEIVTILLGWCLVPFTLFVFWLAYSRAQESLGLIFHGILLATSIMTAIGFYRSAKRTLQSTEDAPFNWRKSLKTKGPYIRFVSLCVAVYLSSYAGANNIGINGYLERTIGYSWALNLTDANLARLSLPGKDLEEAKLIRANLQGSNLSNANLHEANLGNANLSGTNLDNANLSEASLGEAILRRTNLQAAKMDRANLIGANLSNAILINANLSKANLTGVNLSRSRLDEANLSGAILDRVNFDGAHLFGANLNGDDLSTAIKLNQKMLSKACGNQFTKLPKGLSIPDCQQIEQRIRPRQ